MTVERARAAADDLCLKDPATSYESALTVVAAAQYGVADHLRWQLAREVVARRQAEYNYASVMLERAQADLNKLATK